MPVPPRGHSWRSVLAAYDAAQTTDDNMRHWSWADSASADSANTPAVRRTLRNRARYEAANNSYCRSMVETIANDVIGTGPRLQIVTGAGRTVDQWIEREFAWWAYHSRLASKLRLMRKARAVDGEGIALLTTTRRTPTPVTLSLRVIESEQLSTPTFGSYGENAVDGIRFDDQGVPINYDVLRYHPGDSTLAKSMLQFDTLPASDVLHVFREDRPGQHRGIPEMMPALPLFSQLRRFTLATLAAAETAANIAMVVETNRPEGGIGLGSAGEADGAEAFDVFELTQRMVTVLPEGTKLNQLKAEHPATTYGEFKREILAEAFAAMVMPYAVGASDSRDSNFASGKLDRRGYVRSVMVERGLEWNPIVYRLLYSWFLEARLIKDYLPSEVTAFPLWLVQVYWDEIDDDIDPVKAANAAQIRLNCNATTLAEIYGRRGQDWETQVRQRGREVALLASLGLPTISNQQQLPAPAQPDTETDNGDEDGTPQ